MTFLKNHNLKEGKQSRKNGHMTKAGWILIALMMMAATTAVVEIAGGTVGVSNQAPFVGVPILSPNPAYQGQAVSLSAPCIPVKMKKPEGNSSRNPQVVRSGAALNAR